MNLRAWLPSLLGALFGLTFGLSYAWVIDPVEYVDTAPGSLRADFRADYLALIASAHAGTGDLARARARLALFPDPNPGATLVALAQEGRSQFGLSQQEASALLDLARALGYRPVTATPARSPSPSPSASATPTPSRTPRPPATRTPTPTPAVSFRLVSRTDVCQAELDEPLLMVEVLDARGQPLPGIRVLVVWDTGQDTFFTGLKPELGLGYADFTLTPGVTYTLRLAQSQETITDLAAPDCADPAGEAHPGSLRLVFRAP
jgi:hypothetical protein